MEADLGRTTIESRTISSTPPTIPPMRVTVSRWGSAAAEQGRGAAALLGLFLRLQAHASQRTALKPRPHSAQHSELGEQKPTFALLCAKGDL